MNGEAGGDGEEPEKNTKNNLSLAVAAGGKQKLGKKMISFMNYWQASHQGEQTRDS